MRGNIIRRGKRVGGLSLTIRSGASDVRVILRSKGPSGMPTKHGRRVIPLPPTAVEVLREHRLRQPERRVALRKEKLEQGALVFCTIVRRAGVSGGLKSRLVAAHANASPFSCELSQSET
jgi:hypothetical protein